MRFKDFLPSVFKSAVAQPYSSSVVPYAFAAFAGRELRPADAWALYKTVGTLAKVVDLIADKVAQLTPIVEINGAVVENSPVMAALNMPGYTRTRRKLIKELTVQELVTGTGFLAFEGNIKFAPMAMDVYLTSNMTSLEGPDGWPAHYQLSEPRRSYVFGRQQYRADMRFIANEFMEVVAIFDAQADVKGMGLSRLQAIRTDVDLKLSSLQHNTSMMKRGATLSGVLNYKDTIPPEVSEAIMQDFRRTVSGAANAGGVLLTSGSEFDFKQMSQTNKDMDWANLVKIVDDSIVARYGVPTTLYDNSAQTYDNYATAIGQLYEGSVIPCFDRIYGSIANALTRRTGQFVEIRHNKLEVEALAVRAVERAAKLHSEQLVTTNEAREIVGYEPIVGGDQVLGPPGLEPLYEDIFTPATLQIDGGKTINGGRLEAESRTEKALRRLLSPPSKEAR